MPIIVRARLNDGSQSPLALRSRVHKRTDYAGDLARHFELTDDLAR